MGLNEKDPCGWGKGISTGVYLATLSSTCLLVYLFTKIHLKQKKHPKVPWDFRMSFFEVGKGLALSSNTLFLDACLLTSERTEIVELRATNLTNLVHFNAFDCR